MKKRIDWKWMLIGVAVGVLAYAMGWIPASVVSMFPKTTVKTGK